MTADTFQSGRTWIKWSTLLQNIQGAFGCFKTNLSIRYIYFYKWFLIPFYVQINKVQFINSYYIIMSNHSTFIIYYALGVQIVYYYYHIVSLNDSSIKIGLGNLRSANMLLSLTIENDLIYDLIRSLYDQI